METPSEIFAKLPSCHGMEVKLVRYTDAPDITVAAAAKCCYSAEGFTANAKKLYLSPSKVDRTFEMIHESPYEHVVFTFEVNGVSRALTHQLVRHRLASYSQQSLRYVPMKELDDIDHYIFPPTILEAMFAEKEAAEIDPDRPMRQILRECPLTTKLFDYLKALDELASCADLLDIPAEDMRYFYPMAIKSDIVVTMNARELLHFVSLRSCNRAQWEIRELAVRMMELAKEVAPHIMAHAGPSCVSEGKCHEPKPCGMKR